MLVFVGCATAGELNLPQVARNDAQPAELHTSGPLVEVASISIGEGRQPAVLLRAETVTDGAYGDLDDDDFAGTAVVSLGDTDPIISSDTRVAFESGGVLGTAGITYRTSPDDGETWSGLKALGTETSILVAESNVTFEFTIPADQLTALIALRLAKYFGTTAELWVNLQSAYDLRRTRAKDWPKIERRVRILAAE